MNTPATDTIQNLRPAELWSLALDCVRALALLDSPAPAAMRDVLDDLRDMAEIEIERDLIEVSPGAFLPSHEARQLAEARRHDELMAFVESRCELPCLKLTPGCSVDHSNGDDICETW